MSKLKFDADVVSRMWQLVDGKCNLEECSYYESQFQKLFAEEQYKRFSDNWHSNQKSLESVYKDLYLAEKIKYIADELTDQNFKTEFLYHSEGHGIKHNKRVAFFSVALAYYEKMTDDYIRILVDASKYHDIGRVSDEEDDLHGERSTKKIEEYKIVEYENEEDLEILKYVVTNHSIDDKTALQNVNSYNISNTQKAIELLWAFKDADALDRVRIHDLDPNYLRTESAKMLVKAAFELYPRSQALFKFEDDLENKLGMQAM